MIGSLHALYGPSRRRLLAGTLFSLAAGAANGLLMVVVADIVAARGHFAVAAVAAFGGLLAAYLLCRYRMAVLINAVVERMTVDARIEILEALQQCPLETFERIGHEQVHTVLTDDCATISRFVPDLVEMVSGGVTIAVCLAYLLYLAPGAFGTAMLFAAGGVGLYLHRQRAARDRFASARTLADRTYRFIVDFLGGYKELKLNRDRRTDFFANHLRPGFRRAMDLRTAAHRAIQLNYTLGLGMFFGFLGFVLFGMPHRYPQEPDLVARITVVVLYLILPGGHFFYCALQLIPLKVALENLDRLWRRADAGRETPAPAGRGPGRTADPAFRSITLEGVGFDYPRQVEGEAPFGLHAVDLTLRAGERVFVTGGNGSGKTTLAKVIAGLYRPCRGRLYRDGRVVDADGVDDYRHLFEFVFNDFHLFDRLYGRPDLNPSFVVDWLRRLDLARKVSVADGVLSTTRLSAGQQRRLALLAALAHERPVLVVDELTADQEASFREYFYGPFLDRMRDAGRTLVVVTHDDRYFHRADRLIRMEDGRVRPQ